LSSEGRRAPWRGRIGRIVAELLTIASVTLAGEANVMWNMLLTNLRTNSQ